MAKAFFVDYYVSRFLNRNSSIFYFSRKIFMNLGNFICIIFMGSGIFIFELRIRSNILSQIRVRIIIIFNLINFRPSSDMIFRFIEFQIFIHFRNKSNQFFDHCHEIDLISISIWIWLSDINEFTIIIKLNYVKYNIIGKI